MQGETAIITALSLTIKNFDSFGGGSQFFTRRLPKKRGEGDRKKMEARTCALV